MYALPLLLINGFALAESICGGMPDYMTNYKGQSYGVSFCAPNNSTSWYTHGQNVINATVMATAVGGPPMPPVSWVLRNGNKTLLPQDLVLQENGDFTPPKTFDIHEAKPGNGYVVYSVLSTNTSVWFGNSQKFQIIEGEAKPTPAELSGGTTTTPKSAALAPHVEWLPLLAIAAGYFIFN